MTDRELLELAAKAAGLVGRWATGYQTYGDIEFDGLDLGGRYLWNPLVSDGDALRLAACLRLVIRPGKYAGDGCTVETQRDGIASNTTFYDDKCEQMRRAIVLAAAEIGKAMK